MTTGLIGVSPAPIVLDDFEVASLSASAGGSSIYVKSDLDLEGNDLRKVGDLEVQSVSGRLLNLPVVFPDGLSLQGNLSGLNHVYGSGSFQGFSNFINIHSAINMEGENITHIGGIALHQMQYNPFDDQAGSRIVFASPLDGGVTHYVRGRILARQYYQSSRPTLLDGEIGFWRKSSTERYLIYRSGSTYVRTSNLTLV